MGNRVPLVAGFYEAKSLLAGAQRCLNLYPEANQADAPYPITYYPTPGLVLLAQGPSFQVRGLYNATNGGLYAVIGSGVYFVDPTFTLHLLGHLSTQTGQVSMIDNRLVVVIVDGSTRGFTIDLTDHSFAEIVSDAFYGADVVRYLDTYFLFNRPGTNQFYWSVSQPTQAMFVGSGVTAGTVTSGGTGYVDGVYPKVPLIGGTGSGLEVKITVTAGVAAVNEIVSEGSAYQTGDVLSVDAASLGGTGSGFAYRVDTLDPFGSAFDPLDIGAKIGGPDAIVTIAVVHREIWLIGTRTTEIWYDSGSADTAFERMPGAFIEHGIAALYSLARADISLFWLARDDQGRLIVVRGAQYDTKQISTYAIENEFMTYAVTNDAIGFTYQQEGHTFYQLTFPSADKTWVYDIEQDLWHERASTDEYGSEHRSRANCCANSYARIVVGDFENGALYAYDLNVHTDNGTRIPRRRGFPHLVNGGNRVAFRQLLLQMDTGRAPGLFAEDAPQVSLRYSDTHGATWGNPVIASVGSTGEYLTSIQFNQLGLGRDRVFEVFWDFPYPTALQGAWVDARVLAT